MHTQDARIHSRPADPSRAQALHIRRAKCNQHIVAPTEPTRS